MAEALRWWLTLSLLGLLSLPLTGLAFRSLPDRGYTLSRALGWTLSSWLAWLGAATGLVEFGTSSSYLAAAVLGLASAAALLLHRGGYGRAWRAFFNERWIHVLSVEAAFSVAFAALVLLRAFIPHASQTEKPMEYMLLQSTYSAATMPPPDLWLAGERVNYYYFGFFMNAFVARLSGVEPPIAFNLALAGVWAVTAVTIGGLAYNAVSAGTTAGLPRVLAATSAPVLVLLMGNPAALEEVARRLSSPDVFDWFGASTRVIYDQIPGRGRVETINEFPAFSFLLGDLHPHVLAMPLFGLGLGCSLALLLSAARPVPQFAVTSAVAGAVCGWLYMSNSWDVPVIASVTVVASLLGSCGNCRHLRYHRAVVALALIVVLGTVVALPFASRFDAPVSASAEIPPNIASLPVAASLGKVVGPVWWDRSEVGEFLRVWGIQLAIVVVSLFVLVLGSSRSVWRWPVLVTLLAVSLALALSAPVLLLVPVVVLCWLLAINAQIVTLRWGYALTAMGLGLIVLPELLYLRDVFENRMNTVFKVYYQAWQLLGISAVLLLLAAVERLRLTVRGRIVIRPGIALLPLLLVLALAYPYAGVRARAGGDVKGLDATAFLQEEDPGAALAVEWLRWHSAPEDGVLEATGGPYSLYGRVSTYAGRPTVLGWANHERQWRAGQPELLDALSERERLVTEAYTSSNRGPDIAALQRLDVRYAYYGRLEREMQREQGLPVRDPFAGHLQRVWSSDEGALYEVR